MDEDPYSMKKGFFHAHMSWMFFKSDAINYKIISDLTRNKLLIFQHKHYIFCMLATNIITFVTVGWALGDFLGAFVFAWWVRLFCLHHTTWCINSLAHYWGTKYYSKEHSAVDNYLISLLTYGEGYHNYHHTFANDYRNGICWYHFDPSKWLIWILHKIGLASNLKRVSKGRIYRQLLISHRDSILENIRSSFHQQKDRLIAKVNSIYEHLSESLAKEQILLKCYQKGQKEALIELRNFKKSLKQDWKEWKETVKWVSKSVRHTPST